jgi:large subunit ribosomal protein L30
MAEVTIKQVRSPIHSDGRQRDTLRSLKLGSIGKTASFTDSPNLRGMIRVVNHLVEVDEGASGKES